MKEKRQTRSAKRRWNRSKHRKWNRQTSFVHKHISSCNCSIILNLAAFPLALTLERSAAIIAVWTRPLVTLVLATALQRKPIGNDLWGKKKKKKKSVVTVEISMNTFRKGMLKKESNLKNIR